jgi:predicted Fe-S protein YdhL (DUF1289 family)
MIVESPCIGRCRLAENEAVCAGCHRTLSEITSWHRLADAEKLRVLTAVRERKSVQDIRNQPANCGGATLLRVQVMTSF